jgi:cellulose biosynthesis protein BcsQ
MAETETETTTAALVGATGGAGTTRTTVELALALAADGRDVAVLDAAFATQGLSDYLPGALDPDLTALVTDERGAALSAGLVAFPSTDDLPGRAVAAPVRAPFERFARAKRAEAARALADRVDEAAAAHDHVLLDVPPVASNQAVAAVESADRVALLSPTGERGSDAGRRLADRLADLGAPPDARVVTGTDDDVDAADATLSLPSNAREPGDAPAVVEGGAYASGVEDVADAALGVDLSLGDDGLLSSFG